MAGGRERNRDAHFGLPPPKESTPLLSCPEKWYATGQVEQKGNRDTWLERLSYALARNYTLNVTDRSHNSDPSRDR